MPEVLDVAGIEERKKKQKEIKKRGGAVAAVAALVGAGATLGKLLLPDVKIITPEPKNEKTYTLHLDGSLADSQGQPYSIPLTDATLPVLTGGSQELREFQDYLNNSNYKIDWRNSSAITDKFGDLTVTLVQEKTGNKVSAKFFNSDLLKKLAAINGVDEVNIEPKYRTTGFVDRHIDDPLMLAEVGRILASSGAEIPANYSHLVLSDEFNVTETGNYTFNVDIVPKVRFVGQENKTLSVNEPTFERALAFVEDGNPADSNYLFEREQWKQTVVNLEQLKIDLQLMPSRLLLTTTSNPDEIPEAVAYLKSRGFWSNEYNQSRMQGLVGQTNITDLNDLLNDWTNESRVLIIDTPDDMQYSGVAIRFDGNMVPYAVPLTEQDLQAVKRYG